MGSYKILEHATDLLVEVRANTLHDAMITAGNAVIDTTLDTTTIQTKQQHEFCATGKDLDYLLYSWLEEIIYLLITQGFAIKKLEPKITTVTSDANYYCNKTHHIKCLAFGEPINLDKHGFRVEIKAPTFHDMQIKINKNSSVYMRFLLDL